MESGGETGATEYTGYGSARHANDNRPVPAEGTVGGEKPPGELTAYRERSVGWDSHTHKGQCRYILLANHRHCSSAAQNVK